MLKITKSSTPITIKNIVLCEYSLPGLGKTSLSFTANKPLLLDADKGSHRAKNRKDVVEISSWADIADIAKEDLDDYDTVILDTVGRALDFLSADIIAANPKHGYMGNLSLQGYGVLKGRFTGWLNAMRTFGKDVILISHMEEKQEGDVTKERFDIQGGSRSEVYKSADAICKLYIDGKLRKLDFNPREGSLGKNPAQLPILTVPDYTKEPLYLAGVIQSIKDSINQLSESQRSEVEAVEAWKARIAKASTAEQFNALLPDAKTASAVVKALVFEESKKRGLKFDKEAGNFYNVGVDVGTPDPMAAINPEPPKKPLEKALEDSLAKCDAEEQRKATEASQSQPEAKNMPKPGINDRAHDILPKDCTRYMGVLKDAKAPAKGKKFGTALLCWDEDGYPVECPLYIWDAKVQKQAVELMADHQINGVEVSAVVKRTVKNEGTEKETKYYSLESFELVPQPALFG